MASWTRDKVDSEDINFGNQYEKGDRISREQLNAMVNSGLYAQDFAEHLADTPDTSEANNIGTPSVEIINNGAYRKFKFSNLKGEKGDRGEQGIQGEKGDKGDKGDKGEQGIQGIQGIQGEAGKDGAGCYINGIATDVNFTSDPQEQIDGKANIDLSNVATTNIKEKAFSIGKTVYSGHTTSQSISIDNSYFTTYNFIILTFRATSYIPYGTSELPEFSVIIPSSILYNTTSIYKLMIPVHFDSVSNPAMYGRLYKSRTFTDSANYSFDGTNLALRTLQFL